MEARNNYNPGEKDEAVKKDMAEDTSIEASTGPDDIIKTDVDVDETDNSKTQSDLK